LNTALIGGSNNELEVMKAAEYK
jgi:hypothetical protein